MKTRSIWCRRWPDFFGAGDKTMSHILAEKGKKFSRWTSLAQYEHRLRLKREAIADLEKLEAGDHELAHIRADAILLSILRSHRLEDVADAYIAADKRCGFQCA